MRNDMPAIPGTKSPPTGLRAPHARILAEITTGLTTGSDLDALLQRFLEPIVQLAGASAGAVRVLSEDGGQLLLVSSLGLPEGARGSERAVDSHCGHCGAAADRQVLVWGSELSPCLRHADGQMSGTGFLRMLAVPLQHRGRTLGVYNLFFDDQDEPTGEILGVLRSIGELIGLALNNARLEAENLRARLIHERQQMAADIHDSIAQTLTFVKMRLPLLEDAMVEHDDPRALKFLNDVREAVGDAHLRLREIVTECRTRIDPRGLAQALDGLALRFRQRSGIELAYTNSVARLDLPAEVETDVFHIAQEALANIERHSGARHSWLTFETAPRGFEIRIEDDGVGLAANDASGGAGSHFGIGIMSERAHRLGGELTVTRRPTGGTLVRLEFPALAGHGVAP